ncbi:MAG: crossover junction endodeoxyribonuclease RuvC [Candidatus Calescibacterium sp.]|nr:crossover junction endodeoxyribonuclease RuvC [Candidatus Calescibacterium sp.]MCX7734841.1 crossover junction endodeoxyribonuclease RuvC [bacterium]
MRVLGIDPGLRELGWAVLESKNGKETNSNKNGKKHPKSQKYTLISFGLITTSDDKDVSQRLSEISCEVQKILNKFKPDLCAMESVFVWKDPSAALKLGMVIGTCIEVSRRKKVTVDILSPLFIKSKISGDRYADKDKIGKYVLKKLSLSSGKKLNGNIPHHITDAIAIALSSFYK